MYVCTYLYRCLNALTVADKKNKKNKKQINKYKIRVSKNKLKILSVRSHNQIK